MSTAETSGIAEVWERYATAPRTPRREINAAGARTWFNWTSYPDHGPDESVLGPLAGAAVLELGSGSGCNLAHLNTLGAFCTGLDISPSQGARARARWGGRAALEFVTAEATDYLERTPLRFDAVYSVFGAAWFTDPHRLLPLVRERLRAGGVFVFSHTAPTHARPLSPGARVTRYDLDGGRWTDLLLDHGFATASFELIDAPDESGARTLLVRARA